MDGFRVETRRLLLERLRLGVWISLFVNLVYVPIDPLRFPGRAREALAIRIATAVLLLPVIPLARSARLERWAMPLTVWVVAVLAFLIDGMIPLCRAVDDPAYPTQVVGLLFLLMGTALLLPVNGREMVALGMIPFAGHVATTLRFPFVANFPYVFGTATAVAIAAFGTWSIQRTRRGEYEARIAKDALLRARSDFVAMLTHDIRNPLGAIDGYADMVAAEEAVSPRSRDRLSRIQASAREAMRLATNFLDVSKIESDRPSLAREATDPAELVRQVAAQQRCFAELKRVRLVEAIGATLPRVHVDRGKIDRVLANVVNNAIKYSPPGGTVRIAARAAEGGGVELCVEDDGPGIRSGDAARIFDRYTAASSRVDSTGLGLFIARTFTEAHGGTIAAENRTDAPGARFRIRLPA